MGILRFVATADQFGCVLATVCLSRARFGPCGSDFAKAACG